MFVRGQHGIRLWSSGTFQRLLRDNVGDLQNVRRDVGTTRVDVALAERTHDWAVPLADVFDVAVQAFHEEWHVGDRIDGQNLAAQVFPGFEQTRVIGYFADTAVERQVRSDQLLETRGATACQTIHARDE